MSWVNPSTAFSGVLSSWLMLAKNSLFIRLAFSAATLALVRASSMAICPEMSRSTAVYRGPSGVWVVLMFDSKGFLVPSLWSPW